MQKSYCYTPGVCVRVSVGIRKQNVRANVKVMEFQSLCIFSCILTLLIILIKPLPTKAHGRHASGDCGTSGLSWYIHMMRLSIIIWYSIKVFTFKYNARKNFFISYKFLLTCIIQFTHYEQLVNFSQHSKLMMSWWRNTQIPKHMYTLTYTFVCLTSLIFHNNYML